MVAPLVVLGGLAAATVVVVASSGGAPSDDVDNPPRGRVWSDPKTTATHVTAPGWYLDVKQGTQNDAACSHTAHAGDFDKCGAGLCFRCKEKDGEATPVARAFRLDMGRLDAARVVAVDVRIVDDTGIVARTKPRTTKKTTGRKRGSLDVN